MKKQTIVDQIELRRDGAVQVRMHKISSDGDLVGNHRTVIEPGGDIEGTKQAVNAHLQQMGWPAVADDEWARVTAHSEIAWTPEIVAAHEARKEEPAEKQSPLPIKL